jgi:protein tyrosine phosphatase (PTP) superfamily phosphohydrolase (DUF442 family)
MHRPIAIAVCGCLIMAGCAEDKQPSKISLPNHQAPQKVDANHLPNAYQIHQKVISGGLPDGDAAFAELESLGVKTVISVDGAKPDVELARQHGMRYVHLPHGYDGVPDERAKELAKAVRDFDGPIYIHCHHGKHRSPAAATVACVSAGLISPDAALGVLKTAGTSNNYRGLYQSAESAHRLDDALLDQLQAEFPETAKLPAMAEAMVAIEHHHDLLKEFAAKKWQKLANHPDLEPAHEALLLREAFAELLRTDEVRHEPERFQQLMREAETTAKELEATLRTGWHGQAKSASAAAQTDSPPSNPVQLSPNELFTRITNNCQSCHKEFRDVPLGEKMRP